MIPFEIDKENEAGRKECYPDEPNPLRFTVMKHLDGKDGEAPGILMLDSAGNVHGVKKMPYSLFELRTKPGPGKTELVEEPKLSDELLDALPWFLCFELEHLLAWLEALNQQYYGLSLGTVTNEVWAQKLQEQANSVFTGMLLLLHKTCGMSSGAQLLADFKGLSLRFGGDCAKYAANIEQYIKLLATQDTPTTALCHIISQAPPDMERLWDEQQQRFTLASMDTVIKDFTEGKKETSDIVSKLVRELYEIDMTCWLDGVHGTVNLFQETDAPGTTNSASSADWRASAVCDALVIRRKCPEHSKGECQFNHDEAKAAALRADTAERARIEARLERREQVRRDRQAKAAGAGGAPNQRTPGRQCSGGGGRGGSGGSGGARTGGRGGGNKRRGNKKTGSDNVAAAETNDCHDDGEPVSMNLSRYSGARVMHLGGSSGRVPGNSAQRTRHTESRKGGDPSKVDKDGATATVAGGGPDSSGGAWIYGGRLVPTAGPPICSIVSCVTGTHGVDSDVDAPCSCRSSDQRRLGDEADARSKHGAAGRVPIPRCSPQRGSNTMQQPPTVSRLLATRQPTPISPRTWRTTMNGG